MNDGKKDLRVSDVMQQLCVSQAAVLSWIRSGRLLAYNVAVSETARPIYRVTQDAVDAFKESRTSAAKNDSRRRKTNPAIPKEVTKFF